MVRPPRPSRRAAWRGVLIFLGVAFGLSWVAQIGLSLGLRGNPQGVGALGGGVLVAAVFLMWPPAVGAWVARRVAEGGSFSDSGLRWPSRRYVLLAWFGPAVLTVLAALLSLPIYSFDSELSSLKQMAERFGQELPASPETLVAAQLALALTFAVPINGVFAFGEELGWRGYLLPRLMQLLGPWPGMLAHGAIWGLWHAPLILLTGYKYPTQPILGVGLFVVSGVLLGVLLGWLQLASASVVAPTIGHAALNAIAGAPLLLLKDVDPAVAGVVYSPVGWFTLLLAIALLIASGAIDRALRAPSPATAGGGYP